MEKPNPAKTVFSDEYNKNSKWPLKKVLLTFVVALAVFSAGVGVGRGNLQVDHLSVSSNSDSGALNYSSVNQVYSLLKQNFDGSLDTTKLINGAKEGLVSATGDPYTEYFDPTSAKSFNNALSGTITGIGAEIGSDDNGNIQVISPIDGYPAQKAGLQPKDLIAAIDGTSTSGMSVDAAVLKIRGPAGSVVKLTIIRNSGNPFVVSITREKITIASVTWNEQGNIGYLKITQFTDDTVDLAQKAANEFKQKGVKGVVLDLRGNPGGYLTGAVNVSSLWLDNNQTVVSERRSGTVVSTEYASGNNTLKGLPTVVLIDGGSASASEITAGALHDNHDATLLGTKSFGKGSVQQIINLGDGSEMKVTIAHWYTPNGININKKGITPDTTVTVSDSDIKAGNDPQKDAAIKLVQTEIK